MSRRRPVLVGFASLAVVLAVLLLVTPTGATGCARAVPADIQFDDGRWLVLQVEGCSDGLFAYDGGWQNETRIDIHDRINASYVDWPFSAFVAAPDGGWWFVSERGRAYRFSESFQYQNQTLTLPVDRYAYLTGVEIDGKGRWWAATRDETTVYDSEQNETIRTFHRGADDLAVQNGSVWFLTDGRKGGLVHEYGIQENGGRVTVQKRTTHEIGPEVFNPTVLERGPDGEWVVYSRYERAFVYDHHWRYTGEPRRSGSVGSGIVFLFPALFASFVGFSILGVRVAISKVPKRPLFVYLVAEWGAAALSISVRESLIPPSWSFIYWFPDQFVAALLLLPTVFGIALLERLSLSRIVLITVANLPLLVVSWDFWTSVG